MTFDPTKPVQCRNGRKARIVATNRNHAFYPIIAIYDGNDGAEAFDCFTAEGSAFYGREYEFDLINVPETKSWWVNVYANGIGFHPTEYEANKCAMVDRITLLEIRMCDGKHVDTIQHEVEK